MTTLLAIGRVLAEDTNNFGDTRSGSVAGPLGLVVTLFLLAATVLLIRNMNARLRRLPKSFPPPEDPGGAPDDGGGPSPKD